MPAPPRITFLITDLHRGGSPLMLADLAAGLASRGKLMPDVVSISPLGEVTRLLDAAGIETSSLGARHNRDPRILPRFLHHLRERHPRLICSILIHANLLAAAAHAFHPSARVVQSLHTLQQNPRWHWYAQGLIAPFCDAFVAPTHAILHRLAAYGSPPNPHVIPNGIDLHRFQSASPIATVPWPTGGGGATVVGYIGRFDPVKRLPLLLHALARLPAHFHLALIGYGPDEKALRHLASSLNLKPRIHFLPRTSEPERWYKRFHLFASPSAAEGFGLTLVEARAAGLPVVTCDTPATREVLRQDPAITWLSPNPTPQEIARALPHAASLPPPPHTLPHLSKDAMISSYESFFLSLL